MYNVQLTICTKRGKGAANFFVHKLVRENSQDSISSCSLSTLDQDEFTYVEHTHSVEVSLTIFIINRHDFCNLSKLTVYLFIFLLFNKFVNSNLVVNKSV